MTRTSPMISVILPMLGLMLIAGLFGLILLGGGITSDTAQATTRLNVFNLPIDRAHVKARGHTRAEALLPNYLKGVCEGKWVGYNITKGMVLVACGIPNTNPPECLLVGYQITENGGNSILVEGAGARNTTAYVDYCWKAYKRQGYLNWNDAGTWVAAPLDLKAAIISAFGNP